MARRVHEVEPETTKVKRHGRGRDRNAPVLFHLHEVRARAPRLALGAHLSGHLNGTPVEEEFLGQGRLARIWMRDDRKGTAAGNLCR